MQVRTKFEKANFFEMFFFLFLNLIAQKEKLICFNNSQSSTKRLLIHQVLHQPKLILMI
jgi:hypothetical protein